MKLSHFIVSCLMLVLCMSESAYAQSSNKDMIKSLQKRLKHDPNDQAARYNLGTIYYQDEAYDKAQENLNNALALATPALRADSAYNLGSTLYRIGQSKEDVAPQEALRSYAQALNQYELAIRENASDEDARHNYELVTQRVKWLRDQLQQQSQSDKSQSEDSQGESQQQDSQNSEGQAGDSAQEEGSLSDYQAGEEDSQQASQSENGDEQTSSTQGADPSGEERDSQQIFEGSDDTGESAEQLSREQALWILDSMKQEEAGSFLNYQQRNSRQKPVGRDW